MLEEDQKPEPQVSRKDKIKNRLRKFVAEDDSLFFVLGGVVIGAGAVIAYPNFFFKAGYNPNQPIPSIGLSEDQLRRDLISGMMVSEYLKDRGLVKDLTAFGTEWFDAVNAAGTDRDAIRQALDLGPGESLNLLSYLKLER